MTTSKIQFRISSLLTIFVFALAILFFNDTMAQIKTFQGPKVTDISPETRNRLNANLKPCPDLKAEPIKFEIVGEKSTHVLRVKVTGIVTNIGSKEYRSNVGQQSVNLYIGRNWVNTKDNITSIAPSESVSVSYTMDFHLANEFPETAKVSISYDPDILNDGNPMNDDCTTANNTATRSMADVHDIPYVRGAPTTTYSRITK